VALRQDAAVRRDLAGALVAEGAEVFHLRLFGFEIVLFVHA
jgi:hypothetical protein